MKRVLHIIESFNGQATETWLYQIMCHIKESGEKVDWTFYVTLGRSGIMDDAVREVGGKIIYSPCTIHQKARFIKALRMEISAGGYDILHSHHDVMSAIYIFASAGLHLDKRIVHVHNTSLALPTSSVLKKALALEPMRLACLNWADRIVGVSSAALDAFLKGKVRKPGRDLVIHCGIDTAPLHRKPPVRQQFLRSHGFPDDARVLLFVGRMISYKNPLFVIDVLECLSRSHTEFCAVFAGAGPLVSEVNRIADSRCLGDKVRALGWHDDVPALMQACDLLIWPGLEDVKEGLGLAVVEAQAAGLPVLMSLNVPEDAIVLPELVSVLPLAAGASTWAEKVACMLNGVYPDREVSLATIEASSFFISQSAANILTLYEM